MSRLRSTQPFLAGAMVVSPWKSTVHIGIYFRTTDRCIDVAFLFTEVRTRIERGFVGLSRARFSIFGQGPQRTHELQSIFWIVGPY